MMLSCSQAIFLCSSSLGSKVYCLLICKFIANWFEAEYIGFVRSHYNPSLGSDSWVISYHLKSRVIFIPLMRELCVRLVRRSVTQTSIRYESHSAPIAIPYIVTGALNAQMSMIRKIIICKDALLTRSFPEKNLSGMINF